MQSGGTLIECHNVLAHMGARHGELNAFPEIRPALTSFAIVAVSAYVTHGVFPNFSWMKFKADTGGMV